MPEPVAERAQTHQPAQPDLTGSLLETCQPAQPDLRGSLQETWGFFKQEHPEEVEAGQLRIAIERSLLDSAVQLYTVARGNVPVAPGMHEETLGVSVGATQEE